MDAATQAKMWEELYAWVAEIRKATEDMRKAAERERKAAEEARKAAKETAEEARKAAKETAEEARKVAKETAEEARKTAEEARKTAEKERKERKEAFDSVMKLSKDNEKRNEELNKAVYGVNSELKGIGVSNAMVSEDYFFESLNESKTFGGVHFDSVLRNVKSTVKLKDGTKIAREYDTVMYNDTAICIVEVKYRVRKKDVEEMATEQADDFKALFPMYADYKFYLAVGGMSIEKEAMNAAKQFGIGVLRLKGDAVEVHDKNLKIY